MKKSFVAYGSVFVAALIWGSSAAVGKLLLQGLDVFQVQFYSSFFAAISLGVVSFFHGNMPLLKSYGVRDHMRFAFLGLIGMFLYSVFFLFALSKLSAQEAFIVNYLWPIMVVVWAMVLLHEACTVHKLFALFISFGAIIVVVTRGDIAALRFGNIPGVLSAFLGAVSYGLFSVLGKKYAYEQFTSMMFMFFYATLYSLGMLLFFSSMPVLAWPQWVGLVWVGAGINAAATVLWLLALRYGETAIVSNMIFLTPFLSLGYIAILLGETIAPSSFMGLFILIGAILFQSMEKRA